MVLTSEHATQALIVGSVIVIVWCYKTNCFGDGCDRRTEEQEPQYFDFLAMQNDCLPSSQMTWLGDTFVLFYVSAWCREGKGKEIYIKRDVPSEDIITVIISVLLQSTHSLNPRPSYGGLLFP